MRPLEQLCLRLGCRVKGQGEEIRHFIRDAPCSQKLEVDDTAGIVGMKEMVASVKIPMDDGLGRQAGRQGRVSRPGRTGRVEGGQHGHYLWLLEERPPACV